MDAWIQWLLTLQTNLQNKVVIKQLISQDEFLFGQLEHQAMYPSGQKKRFFLGSLKTGKKTAKNSDKPRKKTGFLWVP